LIPTHDGIWLGDGPPTDSEPWFEGGIDGVEGEGGCSCSVALPAARLPARPLALGPLLLGLALLSWRRRRG